MSAELISTYFEAFNAGNTAGMVDCLADDVAHYVNEGQVRAGREAFTAFCEHMARCYKEQLTEMVILEGANGRFAAEYMVNGTYLETDAGLPEARNQTYRLPAGSFFTVEGGKITRVVTYYNLADWVKQVS